MLLELGGQAREGAGEPGPAENNNDSGAELTSGVHDLAGRQPVTAVVQHVRQGQALGLGIPGHLRTLALHHEGIGAVNVSDGDRPWRVHEPTPIARTSKRMPEPKR